MSGGAGEQHEANCQYSPLQSRAYITSQQADDFNASNKLVIGRPMSSIAIARSDLLSGLGSTAGHAVASQFSHEEYRMWETACSVELDISAADLVVVLKVADALGDMHRSRWLKNLAEKAIATEWHSPESSDAMLCSLLSLPPHLLNQVFEDELFDLDTVLSTYPAPLHIPAILGAISSNKGKLQHDFRNTATLLHILSSSPLPSGLLTEMEIRRVKKNSSGALLRCQSDDVRSPPARPSLFQRDEVRSPPAGPSRFRRHAHYTPTTIPNATGALLAHATATHSSLTKLIFSECLPPVSPPWLRSLFSCLQHCTRRPSLRHLKLSVMAHPFGCAEMIGCLSLLPALTSLEVHFHLPSTEATASSPAATLSSYARLPAMHAALPHLESLHYSDGELEPSFETEGLRFKDCEFPSCAAAFFPHLNAPALTYLFLTTSGIPVTAQDLVACAARFPSLKDVYVSAIASLDQDYRGQAYTAVPAKSPSRPPPSPTLNHDSLHVSSECPVSAAAISAAYVSKTHKSLKALDVDMPVLLSVRERPERRFGRDVSRAAEFVSKAWASFRSVLGSCSSLESLRLGLVCPMHDRFGDLDSALTRLSRLTNLHIAGRVNPVAPDSFVSLDGDMLGRALSQLTALKALEIWCGPEPELLQVRPMLPVLRGCEVLKQLTRLQLRLEQNLEHEALTQLLRHLPALKLCAVFDDDLPGAFDDDVRQAFLRMFSRIAFFTE